MRFPQLTFTRFIAAMIVLLFHFGHSEAMLSIPFFGHILEYANSLLSYFFVLTGFLLIVSIVRNGEAPKAIPSGLFWINRFARIYPLHILALVLTVGLQLAVVSYNPTADVPPLRADKLILNALLLHAWYPDYALIYNYVSWTLCIEVLLSLLAPALYGWMNKQETPALVRNIVLVWVGSLIVHFLCVQNGMPVDWGFYWPPFHIPEFIVGMLGGFMMVRHYPQLKASASKIHAAAFIGSGAMLLIMGFATQVLFKNSIIFAPVFMFIIMSVCLAENWFSRLLSTRPLIYLGEIGYGLFILQVPVSILMLYFFDEFVDWPYKYVCVAFLVVLIAVSAAVYEGMEKPIRNYMKKQLKKRMATLAPEPAVQKVTA